MWPRAYTRKKRFGGGKLNLTPTLHLGLPAEADGAPVAGRKLAASRGPCGPRRAGLKGQRKASLLRKIEEKCEQSAQMLSAPEAPSTQLKLTGEENLQDTSSEESGDEDTAPLSESETDDLQVESSLNSELVSDSCATEWSADCSSSEESLSSFPSPELFRGSDYLDWGCSTSEEHILCKNSTLLDTSKAIAIEKAPLFSNLSAILGISPDDCQKCHRQRKMTLADQNVSPKPQSTSDSESDTATCDILLTEKACPSTPEKPKKYPESRDANFQEKLSSYHLKTKTSSSHQKFALKSKSGRSLTKILPPQSLGSAVDVNSSTPDKKHRGLFTSTPSSQTTDLVIDLSSVQKASFEELVPNVSNYVNSDEIVTVSSLQENSPNEAPSSPPELCCIIRASPGTRQVKSKRVAEKKKYSPPKDFPTDIIITNGMT